MKQLISDIVNYIIFRIEPFAVALFILIMLVIAWLGINPH